METPHPPSPVPRSRPPNQPDEPERRAAGGKSELDGTELGLPDLLGCIADATRLAVLAALGHGARSPGDIGTVLDLPAGTVQDHLRELARCSVVERDPSQKAEWFRLAPGVVLEEAQGDLRIRVCTAEGATVQAQLSMSTPTGRLLARGWGGTGGGGPAGLTRFGRPFMLR